jgi:hypothetical protein
MGQMKTRLLAAIAVAASMIIPANQGAMAESKPGYRSPASIVLARMPNPRQAHRFEVFLTGYSYWDNTPPGSAAISKPVIHNRAGGVGTYNNPITIAVGHVIEGRRQTLDFKPGTRFYIERLRKYAIVEDVCGDGHRPQDGPCHTGYQGRPWLDIYIGGERANASITTQCARSITAFQHVIINPRRDYPVHRGAIVDSGCNTFSG